MALLLALGGLPQAASSALGPSAEDPGVVAPEPGILVHGAHAVDGPLLCVTNDGNAFPALGPCGLRQPFCVADPTVEHHIQLFYVRAPGDPDRYEEVAGHMRFLLARSNAFLDSETWSTWQAHADLKVLCDEAGPHAGEPTVTEVVTPTPTAAGNAVKALGYGQAHTRSMYWNPYQTISAGVIQDNSPGLSNENNRRTTSANFWASGSPVVDAGAVEQWPSAFFHELTHSLGAVHLSTPHANPQGHCSDGQDLMCYPCPLQSDGPNGCVQTFPKPETDPLILAKTAILTTVSPDCAGFVRYDCNHDDYYNLDPPGCLLEAQGIYVPPACYLSGHWNLGDPANLFIRFSSKADPVAAIAAPARAPLGAPVAFSAAPSSDADGDALARFAWDFGDGAQATGAEVSHTFASLGDHAVTLTVHDEYEGRSVAVHTLTVAANEAPQAALSLPAYTLAGETVAFDGSGSADPDGALVSHAWDFGDGGSAAGPAATHAYQEPGRFIVRLTVTDDSGASSTAEAPLVVRGP